MADVYLAHQPGPFSAGKLLVIKQLRSGQADEDQFVQMFADESRIAVRLSHPNVVQTYEAVAEGADYYLVMEFLDGKSLHHLLQLIELEKMPLSLHLWILVQVLNGLHYAHELKDFDGTPLGIVHRDVSPSNVFVTYDGTVKLLDFGIAKSLGAIAATREGTIKGKLGYAAPEQCLCRAVDRRTDLFAVGVMLWEAIAGRRRPMGETLASTYQARIRGTELGIEQAVPTAPAALVGICNLALARDPNQRFQDALEFRQALERYLESVNWSDGVEQLRSFMHQRFEADIHEMRRCIDEHLSRSRVHAAAQNSVGLSSASCLQCLRPESTDPHTVTSPVPRVSAVAHWFRRPFALGVLAVGMALSLGVALWLGRAIGGRKSLSNSNVAITSLNGSDSLSLARTDPKLSGREVSIALSAIPSLAELRLDGTRVSNPYRAVHGRDKTQHHLTASLFGFETTELDFHFDRDIDITVALRSRPQPQRSPAVVRAPATASSRARKPLGSNAETAPDATPSKPGDTLQSNRLGRKLDDSNPYYQR